jgi:hypothetical protein
VTNHERRKRGGKGTAAGVHRFFAAAIAAAMVLVGTAACARVGTDSVQMREPGLPRPQLIVVHDYAVTRDEVNVDSGIGARLQRMQHGTPEEQERLHVGHSVASALTTNLVEELRKLGMRAEAASMAPAIPGPTLSVEGQILSIDEGNKTRRMMVGLGAGASELRTLTQLYQVKDGAHDLVEDFYTTAKSSRKPGLGPMAGAGAAAGRAAESAAIATGVGLATERQQTPEADAKHAAREIARTMAKFFVEQRWITQDQADKLFWDR